MKPVGNMDGVRLPYPHSPSTLTAPSSRALRLTKNAALPLWFQSQTVRLVLSVTSALMSARTLQSVRMLLPLRKQANTPAVATIVDKKGKGKDVYKYTMAVSPLDCMGCGVCVGVCPTNSLKMVARGFQDAKQAAFDYMVENVTVKEDLANNTVMGSQYKTPLLEFSGSCAGCAETSYARLVTQLFGDRMYISNATGCSSIWGGPAGTSPYTVDKNGHGPAWANSLFEDNAEHGYGMYLGQEAIRNRLVEEVAAIKDSDKASEDVKAACDEYLATLEDGEKNSVATKKLVDALPHSTATAR